MPLKAPKPPINLSEYRPVIEAQLQTELAEIDLGKIDNASLIQGMMEGWSVAHYLQVLKQKGKGWQGLSPLADKVLQIQGMGIVQLVSQIVGNDLTERTVRHALSVLKRLNTLEMQAGGDPYMLEVLSDAKQHIVREARAARGRYSGWADHHMMDKE